ncbi:MAG: S41 family peptidase [Phycisphaerales bacterium]
MRVPFAIALASTALCIVVGVGASQPDAQQSAWPAVLHQDDGAIEPNRTYRPGVTFDRIVATLERRFVDREWRERELADVAARFRDRAQQCSDFDEELAVIHELLELVPASHLQLLSEAGFEEMVARLSNQPSLTFGFELIEIDDGYYVHMLLDSSPAHLAGLGNGDRVLSMDGIEPGESERLDWRSDDAFLPDPPIHDVLVREEPLLRVHVERQPGEELSLIIEAAAFAAIEAARASACIIARDDVSIGYVHFFYVHMEGPDRILRDLLSDRFAECDALILDLRGRGGNAFMVPRLIQVLMRARTRGVHVVALMDDLTRSAKEAIAWEIRNRNLGSLVGVTTAGALLPATFEKVGNDAVLMYPGTRLPGYSDPIEGHGVEPHVVAQPLRQYNNGKDPILDAGIAEAMRLVNEI